MFEISSVNSTMRSYWAEIVCFLYDKVDIDWLCINMRVQKLVDIIIISTCFLFFF